MLPSQSSLSTDTSLLPFSGSGGPSAGARGPGDADADADFDALFADLSPAPSPEEGTPAADPGALLTSILTLPVEPPPVVAVPTPDPALLSSAAPATPREASGDDTEGEGADTSTPLAVGSGHSWLGSSHGRAAAAETPPASAASSTSVGSSSRTADSAGPTAPLPWSSAAPVSPRPGTWEQMQTMPVEGATDPATLQATTGAGLTPPTLSPAIPGARVAGEPRGSEASEDSAADENAVGEGDVSLLPVASTPDVATTSLKDRRSARAHGQVPLHDGGNPLREKFAEPARNDFAAVPASGGRDRFNAILGIEKQEVVTTSRALGTDGAKPEFAMPSTAFPPPSPHLVADLSVRLGAALPASPEVAATTETPDVFRTAHEAVEVVLHAVEHVASREQSSVQLKLSVAGEELAVRVELRADEVRTTFRTDSSELRAALAHEWQQVASGTVPVERPVRVAPASFVAAAEQSALNASAGDTSSRERHAGRRRSDDEQIVTGWRSRPAPTIASLPHAAAIAIPSSARSGGSHRLHTLA